MERRYRYFAYTAFAVSWNWILDIAYFGSAIRSLFLYSNSDDAVRRSKSEEEKIQFARCMEDQAEKLGWLGEGFSKMSRLETGIIRQKPKKQEILPVILNAVNQVMEKAGQKEMDIRLAGEQHIWAVIDGKWTSEAVFNVLDNAVKYGNRGSVIEIELAELTGYAQILIRNEGIGIGREEYHKVFQRFYRGKRRRRKKESDWG